MTVDEEWRQLAADMREALVLFGYICPECMPGEAKPCGGSFYLHAATYLAALRACVNHYLDHLPADMEPFTEGAFDIVSDELKIKCGKHPQ